MAIIPTVFNLDQPHTDFISQLPVATTLAARKAKERDQARLNDEFMNALAKRYLGSADHPDSGQYFQAAVLRTNGNGDLDEISQAYGELVKFNKSLKQPITDGEGQGIPQTSTVGIAEGGKPDQLAMGRAAIELLQQNPNILAELIGLGLQNYDANGFTQVRQP